MGCPDACLEKVQKILSIDIRAVIKCQCNITVAFAMIYCLAVRDIPNLRPRYLLRGRSLGSYIGVTPRAVVDLTVRRRAVQVPNSAPACARAAFVFIADGAEFWPASPIPGLKS